MGRQWGVAKADNLYFVLRWVKVGTLVPLVFVFI